MLRVQIPPPANSRVKTSASAASDPGPVSSYVLLDPHYCTKRVPWTSDSWCISAGSRVIICKLFVNPDSGPHWLHLVSDKTNRSCRVCNGAWILLNSCNMKTFICSLLLLAQKSFIYDFRFVWCYILLVFALSEWKSAAWTFCRIRRRENVFLF